MSELQGNLFGLIEGEIAAAREAMAAAEERLDEAYALKELLVDLLVVKTPPDAQPEEGEPEAPEFRRMVLSALEEATPHPAADVAERLGYDRLDKRIRAKIDYQLRVLQKVDRVKVVGAKVNGSGAPANFYVRIPRDGTPVEVLWP